MAVGHLVHINNHTVADNWGFIVQVEANTQLTDSVITLDQSHVHISLYRVLFVYEILDIFAKYDDQLYSQKDICHHTRKDTHTLSELLIIFSNIV
jgi:hypothetical protein